MMKSFKEAVVEKIGVRGSAWKLSFVLSSFILIAWFYLFRPTCELMFYPGSVAKDYASAWAWLFLIIGLTLRIFLVARGKLVCSFLLLLVLFSLVGTTSLIDRRVPMNEHRAVYRLNEAHQKLHATEVKEKDAREIVKALGQMGLSKSYLFEYVQEIPSNTPTGYYLVRARPQCYCFTGQKSFLLEESGAIHYTFDDRAANLRDPILKANF